MLIMTRNIKASEATNYGVLIREAIRIIKLQNATARPCLPEQSSYQCRVEKPIWEGAEG